jgi:hypothetical protein
MDEGPGGTYNVNRQHHKKGQESLVKRATGKGDTAYSRVNNSVTAPCYSQSLLLADFKENHALPYKKIRVTRKLESIPEKHFVEWNNEGRKLDKNWSLRRLKFMPKTLS